MIVEPKQAYLYAYSNGVKFPNDWYITENFKWNEVFKNEKLSDGVPILEVFENALRIGELIQLLRDELKQPINVHCWVRQPKHNKRVAGAKLSAHLNGLAIDFDVKNMTSEQTRAYIKAMRLPVRVEAETDGWVHIDLSSYVVNFKTGLFFVK